MVFFLMKILIKFLFPKDWSMPVWIGVIKEMKALKRLYAATLIV